MGVTKTRHFTLPYIDLLGKEKGKKINQYNKRKINESKKAETRKSNNHKSIERMYENGFTKLKKNVQKIGRKK
jgi:hypothetical protein